MSRQRVRVPGRVMATYLDGTQAWYDGDKSTDEWDQTAHALFHRVMDAPTRKDGSAWVEMTPREREVFLNYAEAWVCGARDNAGPDDMDALSDLRAITSLIGWLTR